MYCKLSRLDKAHVVSQSYRSREPDRGIIPLNDFTSRDLPTALPKEASDDRNVRILDLPVRVGCVGVFDLDDSEDPALIIEEDSIELAIPNPPIRARQSEGKPLPGDVSKAEPIQ